jgi:hypothetical protein
MTSPDHNPSPPPNGSLLSLHGPEFAADPEGVYRRLRAYGPIAPVELSPGVPGMLVTDYEVALEILRDQVRFPRDARRWQQGIPSDCPILPIMAYRPTCNLTDDPLRSRLREAVTDTLDRVDHNALRAFVERSANRLVGRMSPLGEVDLRTEYALVLPLLVFNELCGCPAELGERMVAAVREVLKWENSEEANMTLGLAVLELMALKRENPGRGPSRQPRPPVVGHRPTRLPGSGTGARHRHGRHREAPRRAAGHGAGRSRRGAHVATGLHPARPVLATGPLPARSRPPAASARRPGPAGRTRCRRGAADRARR